MNMNLELEIGELELDGFSAADRNRIARAVQRELERLFAERGVPHWLEEGGGVARIEGGRFEVAPNSSPESIGTLAARRLYGGIRG
jgi:hypothetical protein